MAPGGGSAAGGGPPDVAHHRGRGGSGELQLGERDGDEPLGRCDRAGAGWPAGSAATRLARMAGRSRRWTRVGTVAACAHVLYELGAGVGMPLASRLGPAPAAALFVGGSAVVFHEAGRRPRSGDAAFAVVNGVYLAAVTAHLSAWPATRVAGAPWLTECEGLSGRLMPAYNVLLYVSGAAALGGLVESGRAGVLGAAVPAALVPWLRGEQHRELARLRRQARLHPGWWNRRLHGP
jgi:hypothetical protein